MESALTVRIPEELHREIKLQAIKEGRSIKSIIEEVLNDYLNKNAEIKKI